MAGVLLAARVAVFVQSVTVYPVLLYIIRCQLFTASRYRSTYPGPVPVLALSIALAALTTLLTLFLHISDILRYAGAFGSLICVYAVPSLAHRRVSMQLGRYGSRQQAAVVLLIAFGLFCVVVQLLPSSGTNHATGNGTLGEG